MVYNRFTGILAVRLVLLVLTLFLLARVLAGDPTPFVLIFLLILSGAQFWGLLKLLNRTNDELAAFFSSFQHKDATRSFDLENLDRNFSTLRDSFNKMTGVLREARKEKEEQSRLNQLMIDQVGTGMFIFHAGGRVVFHNKASASLLGISEFSQLQHLSFGTPSLPAFIADLKPGRPQVYALQMPGRKEVPVSFSKKRFRLGDQDLSLVSMHPIGKELEQQEVGAWQKLIRVLTHEMMNTLTPVVTLSGNIERCLSPVKQAHDIPEDFQEYIEDAVKSASLITSRSQSLMHFVEKYRSLSLMPPFKPESIALKPFLEKQIDFFSHSVRQVDIHLKVEPPEQQVIIDPVLMSQVMVNLIKNALEALAETPRPSITIMAGTAREYWYIAVHDNGPGIAAEHLDNVFVPFFTTRKQGTGVGLSLCRQIMSVHQGSVEIESEPGKGCLVKLLF
ncbi:MAG: ATP-binding protein [Bacteroidales bacterium]